MTEFIKISIKLKNKSGPNAENVWAKQIGKREAVVANIPFLTRKCGLGDTIRFKEDDDGIKVFTKRLETKTRTCHISYVLGEDDKTTVSNFQEVCKHYRKYGIETEGVIKGYAAIAIPIELEEEMVEIAMDTQPHHKEIEI